MNTTTLPLKNAPGLSPLLLLCLAATWLVWGSTYLAIKVALVSLPPFFQMGSRFLVAGALLAGWMRWRGAPWPSRRQWLNALVIGGLMLINVADLHRHEGKRQAIRLLDGFRYVRERHDIRTVFMMLFFFGTLGMNFGIFISVMAATVFQKGAGEFGLLSSVMAVGSVIGALMAARRDRPRMRHLIGGALFFGCSMMLAAASQSFLLFGAVLVAVGIAAQTTLTSATGYVQLATDRAMRGRVMAIHMAITLGGLPLGAPLIGWVADAYGARTAMALGGAAGLISATIGLAYMVRARGLRLSWSEGRPHVHVQPDPYKPMKEPDFMPPNPVP